MSQTPLDVIEMLDSEITEGFQPSILLHQNIDPSQILELTRCFVHEAHEERLTGLIAGGWVIVRVQTELGVDGHRTVAYLAKLKSDTATVPPRATHTHVP